MTATKRSRKPQDCLICGWPMVRTLAGGKVVTADTCKRTWLHWTRESLAAEDAKRAARNQG